MIWIVSMFCVTLIVLIIRHKDVVANAYYQGYRDCIKDAVIEIKIVEKKAMENAPIGEMCAGVIRAGSAHDCEMAVRDLSYRIGRPM